MTRSHRPWECRVPQRGQWDRIRVMLMMKHSPDLFLFLKTCDASMEEIQKHINTHFPDGHSNQPASLLSELWASQMCKSSIGSILGAFHCHPPWCEHIRAKVQLQLSMPHRWPSGCHLQSHKFLPQICFGFRASLLRKHQCTIATQRFNLFQVFDSSGFHDCKLPKTSKVQRSVKSGRGFVGLETHSYSAQGSKTWDDLRWVY